MTLHDPKDETLSDEQFCALLAADAGDAADDPEADALRAALKDYRTETLLWAERRSAAMPSLARTAWRKQLLAAVPQWTLATVAAMTVAVGVVHFRTVPREAPPENEPGLVTRSVEPAAATPGQIADDNALLSSIDAAVHAGASVPVRALGLDSSDETDRSRGSME